MSLSAISFAVSAYPNVARAPAATTADGVARDAAALTANQADAAKAAEADPLADPAVRLELQRLQNRDREVRAHEQAHLAAAGRYATSGPSYTYQRGPDGRSYAIGGEVGIDTSAVPDNPAATIAKARQVRAAALAPADPSGTDLRIAAQAAALEQKARQQLARAERETTYNARGVGEAPSPGGLLSERA